MNVLDVGVPVQELLDLPRIDVLATADDHVLDTPYDVAVSLGVDRREISGMHPTCRIDGLGRTLRVVPVSEHDQIPSSEQFARLAARDDPSIGVDNLDLYMRMDGADGADPTFE